MSSKPTSTPGGGGAGKSGGSAGDPARKGPEALFAPWRLEYLEEMEAVERREGPAGPKSPSFLLDYWRDPASDARNHVIVRTGHGMVLLNRFPYANGHLLVALGDPRPRLLDYEPAQRERLWRLVDLGVALLERALEPHGVNVGMNQGRAAGAGVPGHLHLHVVPRWGGDVNFMGVVGAVRVIPSSLERMHEAISAAWVSMRRDWEERL